MVRVDLESGTDAFRSVGWIVLLRDAPKNRYAVASPSSRTTQIWRIVMSGWSATGGVHDERII
jgi:hypothetical protein